MHLNGIKAQMDLLERNVKGQFKYAARLASRFTVVIGDEEIKNGTVQLKDMEAHEQTEVPTDEVIAKIKEGLK